MLDLLFRKKLGFLLLTGLLCLTGALLITQLPVQLYPQTQRPRVRAMIGHSGMSAVDFADEYADDIESEFLAIDGVDILEVEYENNRSDFTLTFDWATDSEEAKSDVESAMTNIMSLLPSEYEDSYRVRFFSGENAGYLLMGVASRSRSPEELYRILDASVLSRLNQVEDVEIVEIFSVEEMKAEVILRQLDLLAYGLTIQDVEQGILSGYRPESVGRLEEGDRSYSVRIKRGIDSLYDVGRILIARRGNVAIRLQDIADITLRYALPDRAFVMDGARGIRLDASPVDGGNVRQMSQDIMAVLENARSEGILPDDTVFQPYLDPAEYIDRSIQNVVQAALIGAALAMLVVFLGLGEARNTLLIGIALPVTLILSFILMYFFDVSLNLISLGGIALAVGMVIDSSIVVMENIHRFRVYESPIRGNGHLQDLVKRAVRQVRAPVIASILTSVLVFFPISFTAPLTNAILGDQAKAVIFALMISMGVALTLIPLIASIVYRVNGRGRAPAPGAPGAAPPAPAASPAAALPRAAAPPEAAAPTPGAPRQGRRRGLHGLSAAVMRFAAERYKSVLRALVSHRPASVLFLLFAFGLLAFAVLGVLPLIPKEIISPPSSDRIVMFFRNPNLDDPERIVEEVIPEIDGRVKQQLGPYLKATYADVWGRFNRYFLNLKSSRDADFVLGRMQEMFESDSYWYYNVMMWDPAQLPLPRTMDLQISVHGDDPLEAVTLLERVRDVVSDMDLYAWAFTDPPTSLSDEIVMTSRGEVLVGFPELSEAGLIRLVRKVLSGTAAIEFEEGQSTVKVAAEYPEEAVEGRSNLANFLIPYRQSTVPLKHFFDFRETTGVSGIASEDGERIFRLYARMKPGTPAAVRDQYEDKVREELRSKLVIPAGYSVVFDNPQAEMEEAIESLFVALAASVVLIYVLLAFQFNSLSIPLVIIVTVPLGFIGVVFSLFVFGSTLSLNSMLGTILLAGIVVNNAILMIDFYLKQLAEKEDRTEALVEAARIRFTPIIITTLTTICGMLPIAIGLGEGSNIVQPLGIAVSGGLAISTLFTLFVVPIILSFMHLKGESEGAHTPA